MSGSNEAGATELDLVNVITRGSVVNGSAVTINAHNIQTVFSQILEFISFFSRRENGETNNKQHDRRQQADYRPGEHNSVHAVMYRVYG